MSDASNNQGRAFEFACLNELESKIGEFRKCSILKNSSYYAAESAWNSIAQSLQRTLKVSASSAVDTVFELEPLIVEDGTDLLTLQIQSDNAGQEGDVRDILIVRRGIHWEIGLSLKHNHFAVKHSRLAQSLDFGEKWFGVPCSNQYWQDIKPIFERLSRCKAQCKKWSELDDKESSVYVPLLKAFISEVKRSTERNAQIPKKMVEYLLGQFDFYKVISIDSQRVTQIQTYNLRGTLNKPSSKAKPKRLVPVASLPTRLVELDFKRGSNTTVEMYLDGGWQFSFRIHNASTYVEPSLKFDVQIMGVPLAIIHINCVWR